MTIAEALSGIDARKRNVVPEPIKIEWLSELDGRVYTDIISTHEGGEITELPKYDVNTLKTQKLLIPAPYERVYLLWLEAQIDYQSGEINRYANAFSMFNSLFVEFTKYYHRTHMPKSADAKYSGTRGFTI